ncbi:MAG TPA: HWE histidine kinase domain-containing protein [Allosphingosinicella sp.]|nr:HWE histidine kinase domain-containing protein [Allosphingosinicella sp.]
MLDTALDAVVVMTREGVVAGWNEVAERTFGWTGSEAVGRLMSDLIIPQQHREAHCDGLVRYNATAQERVLGRRIEITALDKSGREFPVELSITLAGHSDEALFLGFLRDISERREAEARLRRQATETELLFNVTRIAAETPSFDEALRACLKAICELTGWPAGHALVMGQGKAELVSTSVWHEEVPGVAALLASRTRQLRFTPGVGLPGLILESGEPIWISEPESHPAFLRKGLGLAAAFGFPIKSEGRVVAVLEFFSRNASRPDPDLMLTVRTLGEQVGRVLERRRTEEHLRLLVNELNHRVKNTLAVVQSIAAQTLRGEDIEGARRAFENRLAALAAAHDLLTSQNWQSASLREVIEKAGLGCGASRDRLTVTGPELRVQPRTAVSLAMAVHELCTNAVKYGAFSNDGGRVRVEWGVDSSGGESRLRLVWQEEGGPPVALPTRRGFGTRMIERALAAELGGSARIDFLPEGISCTVEAPLPSAEAVPGD